MPMRLSVRPRQRVLWLKCRNAVRRWPLPWVALALGLIALYALGHVPAVSRALTAIADVPLAAGVATTVVFARIMLSRWRRLERDRHRDWLAALPHEDFPVARAAGASFLIWAGTALCALIVSVAAEVHLPIVATDLLASAAGFIAAVVGVSVAAAAERRSAERAQRVWRAGGISGHAPLKSASPHSRYAIVQQARPHWATRASLIPLGYWPLAQARFQERPKVRARSLLLLLLSLPLGITGGAALAAAVGWAIALHLVNLLLGVVRVAFPASWWLAPTPIRAVRFASALTHRALLGQLAACALLVAAVSAIGGTAVLHSALVTGLGWIGAVCALSAGVSVLALRTPSIARSVLHRWIR